MMNEIDQWIWSRNIVRDEEVGRDGNSITDWKW